MTWVALFFTLFMAAYAAMVLWAARTFSQLPCEQLSDVEVPLISVVIAARNEADHISTLMESLAAQNYPAEKFEIILVDDSSEDSTRAQAWLWAEKIEQLRIISSTPPPNTWAYKKAALRTGIAAAKGEIIVQTDADCQMGPHWLEAIAAHFGPNTALVSGPVLLSHGAGWLERLQCLEMMGLVALGAGAMAAGKPNLVNGANLAFRKDLFE
ncbi:MAG: glycosyltransferase, partial [Bacteroidota bacterium]